MRDENKIADIKKTKGNIKALRFGVKGSKAEKNLSELKYNKKKTKVVKSKKKIDAKLKMQLLKNYGFVVDEN